MTPPEVKPNGSMGNLLTTLASSGDNWVKFLIVGGLILNTVLTKNNGSGIDANTEKIMALRQQTAREVRVIYNLQRKYVDYINKAGIQHESIMSKLGIQVDRIQIVSPPEQLPEYDFEQGPDYK